MPIIVESNPSNAELFTSVTGSSSHVVATLEELKRTLSSQPDEFAIVLGPGDRGTPPDRVPGPPTDRAMPAADVDHG